MTRTEAPSGDVPSPPPAQSSHSATGTFRSAFQKIRYFGDYELLEEIARGGMGIVFKACQVSLNRTVALKLISAGTLATDELVKRFKAEAEAAASLSHPHIVPIYEIGEHEGQHYFSMGFVDGLNLREKICLKPEISNTREAARLLILLARAVQYAHQRGVLHRDIKPSNILLDERGEPHLTDFGLAKLIEKESTLTHTNAVLGTPAYMAPEQAGGNAKDVTTAADVYGLGAVFYEMLTGSPPFGGGTSMETIRQVLEQEPRRPTLFNTAIDRDLETICLKCLEKEPSRRYSSAGSLADDLDRWLRHEPIHARPSGGVERVRKWVQRRPAIAALTGMLLVAVLGGLAVSSWQWRRSFLARKQAEDARDSLRRNLYVSDLGVAFNTFQRGDAAWTTALLERQRPKRGELEDLRGYEWRYLWGQSRPEEVSVFAPEPSTVWSLGFSPSGEYLAVGTGGYVRIWNYRERMATEPLPDSGGGPDDCVKFSPNGKLMASTHRFHPEHGVKVWDVATWRELYSLPLTNSNVNGAAFSPDGKLLALVTGVTYGDNLPGEAKVFDAATGALVRNLPSATSWLYRVCFSRDGRLLIATGGDGTVKLWDVQSGQELPEFEGHRGTVFGLACSLDGKTLASGDSEGNIRLWDLNTRRETTTVHAHMGSVFVLAFSPDGTMLASGGLDTTVKLWDTQTQQLLRTFRGHVGRVVALDFSPNGSSLVSGGFDGTIRVWQPKLKPDVYVFRGHHARDAICVGFSSDGRLFAITTNRPGARLATNRVNYYNANADRVALFDTATKTHKATLTGNPFVFSPTGKLLATYASTNRLQLWSIDTFQAAGELVPTASIPEPRSSFFSFSPDGTRLAAGCVGNRVEIWDTGTRQSIQFCQVGTNTSAPGVLFWRDAHHLLTWLDDGKITLWQLAPLRNLSSIQAGSLDALALAPNGRVLATGGHEAISLLDLPALKPSRTALSGHVSTLVSLAFSTDGKTLAAGNNEGGIKLWNTATGREITTLYPHISYVRALAFSPEPSSRYFASGSIDDTVKLWAAPGFDEADALKEPRSAPEPMSRASASQ